MTRARRRTAVALVVVAAAGAASAQLLRRSAAHAGDIATYTVTKQRFVRRVTADGNLRALHTTPVPAPRPAGNPGSMKIAWLATDGARVAAGDVIVRFDPSDPEKQLRDGKIDLAAATARLAEEAVKSTAAVAGRVSDAALARDELEQARKFQSTDEELFSRNQIIEFGINEQLAAARRTHAEQARGIEQRLTRSNAAVVSVERQKAEMAITRAQSALDAMVMTAPAAGIFAIERDWNGKLPGPGDAVWPAQKIAEIAALDAMEASVYVLEVDGNGLLEGQPAEVVIEARPDRPITGKIKRVDKLAQPRQRGSPVQYFGVVIDLGATERTTDEAAMKPGQRVRAELTLDQQDALVVPRQAVFKRGADNLVYRRSPGGFDPVTVEFGAATAGRVAITKGLAAGDVIALRDPTQAGSGSAGSAAPEDKAR